MKQTVAKSMWTGEEFVVVDLTTTVEEFESFSMHEAMSAEALELRSELLQRQIDQQTLALESLLAEMEDLLLNLRRKRASEEETQASSARGAA